jgi:VIT1/CCC1 family predicted Fe2+/Mn2+ transporter
MRERFVGRLLDPLDRLVEGIYTVLIVLTFTLAVRVVDANASIAISTALATQLFWACFGCAIAWGMIDGVMYILSSMAERGHDLRVVRSIRDSANATVGVAAFTEQLGVLAPLTTPEEQQHLYSEVFRRLQDTPVPDRAGFKREDVAGALGTFLVAVGAALPVVLPLLVFGQNAGLAVRLSNLVACAMLFIMGFRWAKYVGGKPLLSGLFLVLVGLAMVLVAIPLGG